ncbi:hypothetical protein [Salinibaculum salinum]|uniref:hypothetical protein n=1 Tax=Salinibaculum salinum TaxID=3131996 RepID=UPI0030EE0594
MSTILFEERQHFRQDWLWALLIVSTLPAFILVVVVVVDDAGGLTPEVYPTLASLTVLLWGPLVIFYKAVFVTEVRTDGLYLKLWPLHLSFRHVPCTEMRSHEPTSFSPVGEYGGIGVRHNPTFYRWGVSFEEPKAYIADGGEGTRIERADSRPLVVGTQQPQELHAALERACATQRRHR